MLAKIIAIVTAAFGALTFRFIRRKETLEEGATKQKLEDTEALLDDIHQAELTRDKLNNDPKYASRVRNRFTRKH